MAAPTNAAGVKKALANPEPSTHGPSRKWCQPRAMSEMHPLGGHPPARHCHDKVKPPNTKVLSPTRDVKPNKVKLLWSSEAASNWQVKPSNHLVLTPHDRFIRACRRDLHAPSVKRTRGNDPGMSHRDPEPTIGLCEPDL